MPEHGLEATDKSSMLLRRLIIGSMADWAIEEKRLFLHVVLGQSRMSIHL